MIEKTLKDHLASQLSDPVYLDVPANPGARYYKLERTGGSEEDHIRHATFALQAIGPTLWETCRCTTAALRPCARRCVSQLWRTCS